MNALSIKREDAVLIAIDFQEKLMPQMYGKEKLEETMCRLIKGCRILGVPVLVTQQYSRGLGTVTEKITKALTEEISEIIPKRGLEPIEKTAFSAMKERSFVEALSKTGRKTAIITGVEAHVCVQQTALDLIEAGYSVFCVLDCVSSRTLENKEFGQLRMTQSGVFVTGYESVLFELLADSRHANFKQISSIVK